MKRKIITSLFFLGFLLNAFAQKAQLNQLFDQYQDRSGVTSIKIAKPMFSLLSQLDIKDAELESIRPMLSKIDGIRILVVEKSEDATADPRLGLNFKKLSDEISTAVKALKYEELITVNSSENKVRFLASNTSGGMLDNLLLNVNAEGNMVLMMLDGRISMEDVNRIASEAQGAVKSVKEVEESVNRAITTSGEEIRKVGSFNGVEVSSGVRVSLRQSSTPSVKVIADQDKISYVKTQVKGGILQIFVEAPKGKATFKNLHVEVMAPSVNEIHVKAGSQLTTLNSLSSPTFLVSSESGANLVAELQASREVSVVTNSGSNSSIQISSPALHSESTSGSSITLRGKVENASYQVSSAATVNAQDLQSNNVTVNASSAGNLRINSQKSIEGEVNSGATVRYRNSSKPSSQVKVSSGGTLKPF